MTHILLAWTGPKAVAYFPPQTTMDTQSVAAIPNILARHAIDSAIMVKIVPSQQGPVLQVTEHLDRPRRYFDLSSYDELSDYDQQQAAWLARYYTGYEDTDIQSIVMQTEFDSAYPWVNRLLPVYKVTFNSDDHRTAFVYTELGALASLTNDYKTAVQTVFRALHTWNWLDQWEHARVALMLILLLSLLGVTVAGIGMVFLMKNRKMPRKRKLHRIIAYGVWIPLLMFSISGTYHLLHNAYGDNHRGMRLGDKLSVSAERFGADLSALSAPSKPTALPTTNSYRGIQLNAISLVESPTGDLLYRLSIPQGKPGHRIERATRYDGVPIEKPALYFNAKTGEESTLEDLDIAMDHAAKMFGFSDQQVTHTELVTRFGPHYDFRNKRLPVWRIDYDTELGDKLFVDPATGIIVDRLTDNNRYESYSFSFLHKWNFLAPLIGRQPRDVVIMVPLMLAVLATILGFVMLYRSRKTTSSS